MGSLIAQIIKNQSYIFLFPNGLHTIWIICANIWLPCQLNTISQNALVLDWGFLVYGQ